jgi:hypothetical protein
VHEPRWYRETKIEFSTNVGKNNLLEAFGTFRNSKFLRMPVETEQAYMISQNFMHYPRLESSLFKSPAAGVEEITEVSLAVRG